MNDVTVVGDSREIRLAGYRQAGRRLLSGVQVAQLVRAKLAHRPRSRLQVGFGLHIAELLRGRVLDRRVDGLGGRIVPCRDRQSAEDAVPRLVERNDRAGHGRFIDLTVAALSTAFAAAFNAGTLLATFPPTGTLLTCGFTAAHPSA
ncbi:MAG: hypothetical protein F4Y50_04135, partial [Dehalococcoidia bacterium]|nr:hypothetical protein [Dehalococcoidia bacterium]